MESSKEFSSDTDKDETLVTPRFDSGEAETAQPVVPLAVVSGEAETYGAPAYDGAGAPFVPPRAARRASWPLALVLVSALAGSVLGGAGLYLFQKSRQQRAAPAAQAEQTTGANDAAGQTPATPPVSEAAAPAPSPTLEEAGALAAELPDEVAEVPVVAEVPDAREDRKDKEDADHRRDEPKREKDEDDARPARSPAAAAVAEKRGKKGERDDDEARAARPRRVEDDSPDREVYYDRGGARRIGSIVYEREARRERRRQRRQPAVDRVRGIFEGQP